MDGCEEHRQCWKLISFSIEHAREKTVGRSGERVVSENSIWATCTSAGAARQVLAIIREAQTGAERIEHCTCTDPNAHLMTLYICIAPSLCTVRRLSAVDGEVVMELREGRNVPFLSR